MVLPWKLFYTKLICASLFCSSNGLYSLKNTTTKIYRGCKNVNLKTVVEELIEERGINRASLDAIVCEGMLAAYERKYPGLPLKAEFDSKDGEIKILIEKEVVPTVVDVDIQISTKKAVGISKKLSVGDKVWIPFDGTIGRIEILRARQVIASKIRKVETAAVYDEFKDKQGDLIHGTIHKCENGGVVVKIDDNLAFLPKSGTIPGDKCVIGFPIRALLKEVLVEPRHDNQLILDRTSELFLQRLFEVEIPEIFEKLVEIKRVIRAPGYKTKIIVASNDPNIDPVGTCVGVGGSRIKPILKEIGTEKIDVIPWTESRELTVKNALKPAQIDRVELADNDKTAKVWLDEDQRALAIGRMGQNIALASRLAGVDIQLMKKDTEKNQDSMLAQEFDNSLKEEE